MYNDLLLERLTAVSSDDRIVELIDEIEALDNLLSPAAQELIRDLRPRPVTDDVYDEIDEQATWGEWLSDQLANYAGSWLFIGTFGLLMLFWMTANAVLGGRAFDPFPFIFLNLTLSTLAALQAPVILMAQNRQSEKDRAVAKNDFQVNLKNELEIADLHRKVDMLSDSLTRQQQMMNALLSARRQELNATVRLMETTRKEG